MFSRAFSRVAPTNARAFAKKAAATKHLPMIEPVAPVLIGKYPRYGAVLFEQATKNEKVEETGLQMDTLSYAVTTGKWTQVLDSANANTLEKRLLAMESLCETFQANDIIRTLAADLVRQDAVKSVRVISESFEQIYRYKNKLFDCVIVSASKLEAKQIDRIKEKMTKLCPEGAQIAFNIEVDEQILGGLQIHLDDQLIDFSMASQVADFVDSVSNLQAFPEIELPEAEAMAAFKEAQANMAKA
jgi:ATP synthase F1 delta subunit